MKKSLRRGLMALAALAVLPAFADDITVYEGQVENEYIPVYGYYWDANMRDQLIYGEDVLTEMQGKDITAITYYFASFSKNVSNPEVTVLIGESPVAAFPSGNYEWLSTDGCQEVYKQATEFTTETTEWRIEFTTPYRYNNGPLLVQIGTVSGGVYGQSKTFGTNTDNLRSAYSTSFNASTRCSDFMPKTKFEFAASGVDGVEDIAAADSNAAAEFYTLQGVRVNPETAAPGIYVKRQGSKTSKVVVR